MRRVLNFLFALVLALGTGGAELREDGPAQPCSCCETTTPAEPCGCGMPQPSSSQRCGGNQAPSSAPLARPPAAPAEIRVAVQGFQSEAKPCPRRLTASPALARAPETPASGTFAPGEGPPLSNAERSAQLSRFRI